MSDKKKSTKSSPFGYTKDGKVYRKGFNGLRDLEIGEVRDSEEQSIEYFIDKYDSLVKKIDELEKSVKEATNKGSFLMKLLHMKEKMPEYKGIGDFEALLNRLDKLEDGLQKNISENRVKNLEIKTALLDEAKKLKDSTAWNDTAEKMKELRLNWVRTGAVVDEKQANLEEEFHNSVNHFFEEKRKHNEKKRREIIQRSKRYKDLIAEVRKLAYQKDKDVLYNRINEIKSEWEQIGEIPDKIMRSLEGKLTRSIQDLKNQKRRRRIGQPESNRDRYQNNRGNFQQRRGYTNRPNQRYSNEMTEEADPKMIKDKQRLLDLAQELNDMPLNKSIPIAKDLQDKWLKSGKSRAPEIRNIYNKFRETIALIFERNNLERETAKKHADVSGKSNSEQKIIKISVLRDLIKREKTEIKLFEDNINENNVYEKNDSQSKMLISKLRSQKYKLKIKEMLLNQIELA